LCKAESLSTGSNGVKLDSDGVSPGVQKLGSDGVNPEIPKRGVWYSEV
jgi:hypothetical protein